MTRNQCKAVKLAHDLKYGIVDAVNLAEMDWHLLLLAAGSNREIASPRLIARGVLEAAEQCLGYFEISTQFRPAPTRRLSGCLWPSNTSSADVN